MENTPSTLEVARLLMQVAQGFMRDVHQHLRHHHSGPRVTMAQIRALHMAAQRAPTLSEVAEALKVTRPTATRLVDGLEERGWIRRQPDPHDRRKVRLYATESGQQVVQAVQEVVHRYIAARLEGLSEEDLRALYQGLRAVYRLFQERPHSAEEPATPAP